MNKFSESELLSLSSRTDSLKRKHRNLIRTISENSQQIDFFGVEEKQIEEEEYERDDGIETMPRFEFMNDY
jgi:hypothetical protein